MGAAFAACDKGDPQVDVGRQGPSLGVVATSPDVLGNDGAVPIDAPIRIRFSRFLRPDTAVRQSVRVTGGTLDPDGGASIAGDAFLEPTYDVVERVVTYTLQGTWAPGVRYTVTLWSPDDPLRAEDGRGFRAFDGAALKKSITFAFTAGTAATMNPVTPPPVMAACAQCIKGTFVPGAATFLAVSCGGIGCHNAPEPAVGLDLSSVAAIRRTAVGHVAHQTLTGPTTPSSISPQATSALFGVGMPLIDPGQPGSSYFLYKMLFTDPDAPADSVATLADWNQVGIDGGAPKGHPPLSLKESVGGDTQPSDAENQRLRSFVQGTHMPLKAFSASDAKAVAAWIASGAPLADTCTDNNGVEWTATACAAATTPLSIRASACSRPARPGTRRGAGSRRSSRP